MSVCDIFQNIFTSLPPTQTLRYLPRSSFPQKALRGLWHAVKGRQHLVITGPPALPPSILPASSALDYLIPLLCPNIPRHQNYSWLTDTVQHCSICGQLCLLAVSSSQVKAEKITLLSFSYFAWMPCSLIQGVCELSPSFNKFLFYSNWLVLILLYTAQNPSTLFLNLLIFSACNELPNLLFSATSDPSINVLPFLSFLP